jgi:tRNA 2-thiouridine synthesizing protein A
MRDDFSAMSRSVHSDAELDTQGLVCPEPLMLVRNKVRDLQIGEVLHILATDPSTHRDFSNFCRFMGHEMLKADVDGEILQYWIKKVGG